jgi:hypothetical protein
LSKTHAPLRFLSFTHDVIWLLSYVVAITFILELLFVGVVTATLITSVFSLIVLAAVAGSGRVRETFITMITGADGAGTFIGPDAREPWQGADRLRDVVLTGVVAIGNLALALGVKWTKAPRWKRVIVAFLAVSALCLVIADIASADPRPYRR